MPSIVIDPSPYDKWRNAFANERLRILSYVAFVGNPIFFLSDVIFYPDQWLMLLPLRALLQAWVFICYLAFVRRPIWVRPQVALFLSVVIANICVAHMTVYTGGYRSLYYSGLNLILLTSAVIVPVFWLSHLSAQAVSVVYGYGINLLYPLSSGAGVVGLQNLFFLLWTCVACLIGVYLYERLQAAEFQAKLSERLAREKLQDLYSKLEMANTELREVSLRKSEFVSIVSHDLRTPLTAIGGFVDNLLDGIGGPLTDKQHLSLNRVKSNVGRLVRMINDLLDLTKIEAGTIRFESRTFAINDWVESLIEGLQPLAREKGVSLRAITEDKELLVLGDSDKLTQVLTNLVQNACKFTPAGGEIVVEITTEESGLAQICVADTGCGIPSEEAAHVFDKFYRGTLSRGEARGAGLGLAIAKHFVELHEGRIWLHSMPGQGSSFYFTIPQARPPEE